MRHPTLGVSRKRTEEIIREVERTIHRDAKTGEIVIRTKGWEKTPGNHGSRNGSKTGKTASARRKVSRLGKKMYSSTSPMTRDLKTFSWLTSPASAPSASLRARL
jgi:hypothetical protein